MINIYALLDSGSQCALIREDLTNQLELKGAKMKISNSTVKSTGNSMNTKEIALTIFNNNEDYELHIQKVFTIAKNKLNMPSQSPPATKEINREFLDLKGTKGPLVCSSEVRVLIGANAPDVF